MPTAIQEMWNRIVTEFFPASDYEPTCEMDIFNDIDMCKGEKDFIGIFPFLTAFGVIP